MLSGKFGQLGFCLGETVRQKTPLPLGHSQLRSRISQALFVLDMPLLQCLMDLFQLGELPCQLLLCAAAEDQRLLGRVQGALQSIVAAPSVVPARLHGPASATGSGGLAGRALRANPPAGRSSAVRCAPLCAASSVLVETGVATLTRCYCCRP